MESPEEVWAHLNVLHEVVWELTAVVLALGDALTTGGEQRRAAERVLIEDGLMVELHDAAGPSPGLVAATGWSSSWVPRLACGGSVELP